MSRLQIYVAGSTVLANVVLLRAYYERPNFYSAAVYISQSTGSLMFLINLALIITASIGYGLQRLFYGPLRAIETEQLYDKAWFAVSETLLAMTIFREDIGIWFFAMFLCLLGGKVWQWIGEGRVEYLEQQPPANPRLFHARLVSSLLVSVALDIAMMQYCIDHILQSARPGVMVMFGFEYVLLAIASISTLMRYALSVVELLIVHRQEQARQEARRVSRERAREQANTTEGASEAQADDDEDDDDEGEVPGWEEKGRWVFYLDLATDFIKSVVYVGFFMILMAFYGIPLHIMRDLFMTLRSFIKRVNDFIQYRNATRDMNARYPDATAEELERENTCIVCREEMRPWAPTEGAGQRAGRRVDERQRPKKLPCGHILHFSCLRSWLERQQVCPTCRRPVLSSATQNNPNQANPGQQNQQGQANPQQLRGLMNLRNDLRNQIQRGQAGGQAAQAAQPGQQQGEQQNRPAGNMRVYNFGPIRLALGRFPNAQEAVNNLNAQGLPNAAQQVAQNMNQNQAQPQNPVQDQSQIPGLPPLPGLHTGLPTASLPHNPADIQSDILRLQQNIIDSLRQLNNQHNQLEYIHALLAELSRLQQASGVTASNGQELPVIAPLNQNLGFSSTLPQAYFSSGPVLRQGDAGVPEGLVLPEGWTLRPMALSPQPTNDQLSTLSHTSPSIPAATTAPSGPELSAQPSTGTASGTTQQPPSAAEPAEGSNAGESSKQAEPSSLESSWSFGAIPGASVTEGSSSAVAERTGDAQNITRRSATVEDVDDGEQ